MIDLDGAAKLFQWLPLSCTRGFRNEAVKILTQYFAHETSLSVLETPDHHVFSSTDEDTEECEDYPESPLRKRKRGSECPLRIAKEQSKLLEVQQRIMQSYADLCPNRVIDERASGIFRRNLLNIALMTPSE